MTYFKSRLEISGYVFTVMPAFECEDDLYKHLGVVNDDWSYFVIYHAILETYASYVLMHGCGLDKKLVTKLPMNGKKSKMKYIKECKLLPVDVCELIYYFSKIRNHFVHELGSLGYNVASGKNIEVDCYLENIYGIYASRFAVEYLLSFEKFKKQFRFELKVLLWFITEVSGIAILKNKKLAQNYFDCFERDYWKNSWLRGWSLLE